jgi:hypothetical protein
MKQSPAYNLPIAAVPRKAKRPAQQRKGPVPRHMGPQPRKAKQQAQPHRVRTPHKEPSQHRVPALLRRAMSQRTEMRLHRATLRKAKQHYMGLRRHMVSLPRKARLVHLLPERASAQPQTGNDQPPPPRWPQGRQCRTKACCACSFRFEPVEAEHWTQRHAAKAADEGRCKP